MRYILQKKVATIFFAVALVCTTMAASPAYANPTSSNNTTTADSITTSGTYGVYSDTKPTKSCRINNGERKSFQARAYGGYMYTNCLYNGKTRYSITVHNEGSSRLDVSVLYGNNNSRIYSTSIPAGQIYGFTIQGLKTDDKIYIQFTPHAYVPYRFSGHIQ